MADKKISALTAAAIPLDGTEVLPIVQSGATVKVANNDLRPKQIQSNATSGVLQVVGPAAAATRVATVPDANFTVARTDAAQSFTGNQTLSNGNLVIGTSGQGIDFSATPGTGTSELLADYEEGTFTPTMFFGATQIDTYNAQSGWYTKTGNTVFFTIFIQLRTKGAGTGSVTVRSLPFTSQSTGDHKYSFSVTGQNLALLTGALFGVMDQNTTQVSLFQSSAAGGTALTDAVFADFSSDNIIVTGTYQV